MENRAETWCAALKSSAPLPRGPAVRPRFFLLIIHNFEEAYLFVWFRISSQIDVLLQSYELFYSKLSVLSLNGAGEEEEEQRRKKQKKNKKKKKKKKKEEEGRRRRRRREKKKKKKKKKKGIRS